MVTYKPVDRFSIFSTENPDEYHDLLGIDIEETFYIRAVEGPMILKKSTSSLKFYIPIDHCPDFNGKGKDIVASVDGDPKYTGTVSRERRTDRKGIDCMKYKVRK